MSRSPGPSTPCEHPQEHRLWESNWHWRCLCGARGAGSAVGVIHDEKNPRPEEG